MNNKRPKRSGSLFRIIASIILAPILSLHHHASIAQQCIDTGTNIFFANGVNNTRAQASKSTKDLKVSLIKHNIIYKNIEFSTLYNQTEGLIDFAEVFEQRLAEHEERLDKRFELFFETINGNDGLWDKITGGIKKYDAILEALREAAKASTANSLTSLLGKPSSELNYVRHKIQMERSIEFGRKILIVAHSQGNLFANRAFDHASSIVHPGSIRVVHVAPASSVLNGGYVLADLDFVINGLRISGNVPYGKDPIPTYPFRPPGTNNKRDILGHGFQEIYINPNLEIAQTLLKQIDDAESSLIPHRVRIPYPSGTYTYPQCCVVGKSCFPQ